MHPRRLIVVAIACLSGALVFAGVGATANNMATPVKVTVTMTDFKFKLSKTSVPRNTPVVFTVINKGASPHDFALPGRKTPIKPPNTGATLKATFKRAGKVRYICTVPRHASLGMVGNLTVK